MKLSSTCDATHSYGELAALPPTRWSVVARAGDRERETWMEAFEVIARLYRPVFVRHLIYRLRVSPDRAEDLVQTFLLEKLIGQDVLCLATPGKGRFRSFLLKVFSNFVRDQLRGQQAQKRQPSSPDAERLDDLPELPSCETPLSESLDLLWARQVLARTVDLMQAECLSNGRLDLWGVMEARILGPIFNNDSLMPYEELVEKFGLHSPSEASNLLVTAKRMFARVLREVVRETVVDEAEVEAEIMELKRILSK